MRKELINDINLLNTIKDLQEEDKEMVLTGKIISIEESLFETELVLLTPSNKEIHVFTKERMSELRFYLYQNVVVFVTKSKNDNNKYYVNKIDSESLLKNAQSSTKNPEDFSNLIDDVPLTVKKYSEYIFNTFENAPEDDDMNEEKTVKFPTSLKDMEKIYGLLKGYYNLNQRESIENKFEQAKQGGNSKEDFASLRKQIYYEMQCLNIVRKEKNINIKVVRKELHDKIIGQRELVDGLLRIYERYLNNNANGCKIIIVNKRGINLDDIISIFFKTIHMKTESFNATGLSESISITGSSTGFSNGDPGIIFRKINKLHNSGCLIIKNLDKVQKREVMPAFSSMIEDGEIHNEFVGDVTLGNNWVLFIVENLSNVSIDTSAATILSVSDYSDEEQNAIVRRLISNFNEKNESHISMTNGVISTIEKKYSYSMVEAEKITNDILYDALSLGVKEVNEENIEDCCSIFKDKKRILNLNVTSIADIKKKYIFTGESMSDLRKKRITELFTQYDSEENFEKKRKIENDLSTLVNYDENKKMEIDIKRVKQVLDEEIIGQDDAKEQLLDEIFCFATSSNRKQPIILNGPAGIGKTTLVDALAKAGLPIVKIHFNQLTSPDDIMGYSRSIKEAKEGILFSKIKEIGSTGFICMIDEFDKPNLPQMYNPFFNILDKQEVVDKYWDVSFSTSNILFICTSNKLSPIPETIRNRCSIIHMPSYSLEERTKISATKIVPNLLKMLEIEGKVSVTEKMCKYIITNYTESTDIREIEALFGHLFKRLARKYSERITLTEKLVKECLGERTYKDNTSNLKPGVATALAVYGESSGTTFDIEVSDNPFSDEELVVTGLAKDSFAESIKVALTVASKILQRKVGPLHIHCTNAGINKDGPSAGVCILMAIISHELNLTLTDCAFTGELTLKGDIKMIGGIIPKLNAAELNNKVNRVYIPYGNYEELINTRSIKNYSDIVIVPVKDINNLFKNMSMFSDMNLNNCNL